MLDRDLRELLGRLTLLLARLHLRSLLVPSLRVDLIAFSSSVTVHVLVLLLAAFLIDNLPKLLLFFVVVLLRILLIVPLVSSVYEFPTLILCLRSLLVPHLFHLLRKFFFGHLKVLLRGGLPPSFLGFLASACTSSRFDVLHGAL